jgi:phosphatidylcholine synthase
VRAARDAAMPARERCLRLCAWGVHLYTALGAVAGLLSIDYAARGDFRASFIAMAVATAIDSSDGPLARLLEVRRRIPHFDGALLDNIVDYLTYVLAPVFLMLRAGILERGFGGYLIGGIVMVASGYGFCHIEAKTEDHYFRGFPSYWNLVAFYLYCLDLGALVSTIVVAIFAVMVFVPIKYIYPNRTGPLRPVTLSLAIIWAFITLAMLPALPAHNPVLLHASLSFIAYYLIASFILHARAAMNLRRYRGGVDG